MISSDQNAAQHEPDQANDAATQDRIGTLNQDAKPSANKPRQGNDKARDVPLSKLQTELHDEKERVQRLVEALKESRDGAEDLAFELEGLIHLRDNSHIVHLATLRQQLKSAQATRDTYAGENSAMLREIKRLKKQVFVLDRKLKASETHAPQRSETERGSGADGFVTNV